MTDSECDEVIIFLGDGDFSYLYEFVVGQLPKEGNGLLASKIPS